MAQNKTVLTVSYGTFSCTLEGFEDSFGMMKSIAEYFRELAAEDRFFGAKPPAPDAELLSRMASANARTSVSARQEDGRLILSPSEAKESKQEEENLFVAPSETPSPQKPASNISDRLARIRAVVGNEGNINDASVFIEDEHAADEFFAKNVAADEAIDEALFEDVQDVAVATDPSTPSGAEVFEIEDEAIVSEDIQDQAEEIAEDITAGTEREMAEEAEVAPEPAEDALELSQDEHAEADLPDDAESDQSEEISAQIETPEEAADDVEESRTENAAAPEAKREGRRHVIRVQPQRPLAPETAKEETPVEDNPPHESSASQISDVAALNEEQQDDLMKALADIDAELEAMDDENAEDIGADADTFELNLANIAPREDHLSHEEILEESADEDAPLVLKDAIEETEALPEEAKEAEVAVEDSDVDAPIQLNRPTARPSRAARPSAEVSRERPTTDEQSVERLLDETDAQMAKPENSRRRSALAHLRAAVAATMADKLAGGDKSAKEEKAQTENAFREDLAEQVKPARPAPRKLNDAVRETNAQPSAPLRLVAEQRVDSAPAPAPAPAPELSATQYDSFEEFVADVGAVELRDRLEAAAAYISFVEGHERFSRPQLMNKVRQIESQDFNREDGLRSFGQLLREGKIEKLDGGRFTAAQNISFHPERKTANG